LINPDTKKHWCNLTINLQKTNVDVMLYINLLMKINVVIWPFYHQVYSQVLTDKPTS